MSRERIVVHDEHELINHIAREMGTHGRACDLNHLDVSKVGVFDGLFEGSPFVGDISQWDVSGATSMKRMFKNAMFNGDVSQWNVSHATHFEYMFYGSMFAGDLSSWRMRVDAFYLPMVHAQFKGTLPRVMYDNPHESYAAMMRNAQTLHDYAARMPFSGMHADLLIVAPEKCPWASPETVRWALDHRSMGQALSLDYEAMRQLMVSQQRSLPEMAAGIDGINGIGDVFEATP